MSSLNPSDRSNASVWRHDGYTLRELYKVVHLLAEQLRSDEPATLLDFGAGSMPYKTLFENVGYQYLSADLEGCHDIIINTDIPLAVETETIQLVTSFQVLEHVWNLDWYLSEAHRILSEDGNLLLSTHGTWLYHPHPTDFRRWTREGLIREIESRGFAVKDIKSIIGPLAWTSQFRSFAYNHLFGKVPLIGRFLASASNLIFYYRMKLEDSITPRELAQKNAAIYVIRAQKV